MKEQKCFLVMSNSFYYFIISFLHVHSENTVTCGRLRLGIIILIWSINLGKNNAADKPPRTQPAAMEKEKLYINPKQATA